ncbi:hypothetical protein EJB05_16232 [Eragrostis curvula]|uniref:RING-CH-type domain-containing protein n=1 Tax=Eragrostis curvula TaxID=38414 RepID=A0A5J9VHF3_9POAL|nr:hypothetical protein EJB05_16232 [Eragrostis curvula]
MPLAWFPLKMGAYEEIETGSAACCRICLESGSGPDDELISPCMCKGTQQFVHRSCLDHWRSVREGIAFSHCTTCKAQFHLRVQFLEGSKCRQMKFRLFVARDILLVFLAIQAEYVVEDLRGGYTQPKMNPEHEQRLKMLRLM